MPNVKIGVSLGTPDAASAQMETGQAWSFRTGGGGGVLYSGNGAPSLSVGGIGDFYVDETDFPTSIDLYGPKAEGDWGSPITLGAGGVGAAAFTDLTDVPASYTGQGSKIVSVKATEDGLEFTTAPAGSFTPGDLTDAGTDGITITGGTSAVNGSGTAISQHVADTTHNGYLSSTDWNTFNDKQAALSIGDLSDAGTDGIVITGGTGSVIGAGTSIAQTKADATHNGYLDKDDWTTFNSKENALGYTPEDVANKSSDEALGNSNTLYPTQNATKVYVDAAISSAVNAGSRVLSGGGVAWTGTNFDYIISAADYLINGVEHTSAETPVTLAAADVTYDRIDVFYVDDAGLAGVITGTPADNPVAPTIDPATQLYLTFAYVVANSTEPDVTVENIYLENTEWTMTASGGTINVASTNNPYAGTKDIEATNAASGHLFTGVKPSGILAPGDYAALVFEIRSKATWPNPKAISIFFLNGAASVGSAATLKQGAFGFDSSNTTTYQQIVIPIAVFNTGAGIIDRLRFQVIGGGGNIGWYIDNITLQGGGGGGTAGGDFSTNTNVSIINEIVLFADTTGKLGKRSTGTGIAKLTSGVLGTASEGSDYLGPARIDDTAYDATTWNGDTNHAPSKNAIRDKIESLSTGGATRIVTVLSDATSITPQTTGDSNINIQNNTQTAGTLTVNAPSATAEARGLVLRVKCTNAQTLSFNSIFRAPSLLPLPTGISAGKTAYVAFIYNDTDSKWDLTAVMKEYA